MKTKIAIWLTGEIGLGLFFGFFAYGLILSSVMAVFPCLVGAALIAVAGAAELKEGDLK